MERLEKIEKGLKMIGQNIKEAETLGALKTGRKIELAEQTSRLACGCMKEMLELLKEIAYEKST